MNRMMEENTNMEYALEVRGLTKHYGSFVLDQVSLQVPYGMVVGFIGENGAGKSTTIKAILNLIHKETGDIYILGHPMQRDGKPESDSAQWKEQPGVIFDECNMPAELTAKEIHHIMKEFYRTWEEKKFFDYLKQFRVPADKKVKELSKGMKMKLSIACNRNERIIIKGSVQYERICQTICHRYSGDGSVGSLHEKHIVCIDLYGDSWWNDEYYNHEYG